MSHNTPTQSQEHLLAEIAALKQELELSISLHKELLMAVVRKFPNETRHETALRYIRGAESNYHGGPCDVGSLP